MAFGNNCPANRKLYHGVKNCFNEDLGNTNGHDQWITFSRDVTRIRTQMNSPQWLYKFPA